MTPNSENESTSPTQPGHRARGDESECALVLGPRKKARLPDPLVHHGRHFGCSIHALSRVHSLLSNGLMRETDLDGGLEENFNAEERIEHRVFKQLLQLVPGLQERVFTGKEEEILEIADLIQKGANSARSDDTKSLKGVILDWITPKGQSLNPPLMRNVKADHGFHHEHTGALLCPTGLDWDDPDMKAKLRSGGTIVAGDHWPVFLYQGYVYDPEDPWKGLFRSAVLVSAFKHIFTSPSSVDSEPKATRSGNARIHGMTSVTPASIAYMATQVRFALSSAPVFSRTDMTTDSERFYNSIFYLLHDIEEEVEVNLLISWWNRQIFPGQSATLQRPVTKNSALARIKEKRAAMRNLGANRR